MKVIPDMRPEYYKRKYPITSKQEVSGPEAPSQEEEHVDEMFEG